jgi:hypothetical protein
VTRQPTQNERILALLADGRWHTTREILANVPCIVHSRIAEINGRSGYRIEHDGAGGGAENHRYRLVATPRAESTESTGPAVSALSTAQEPRSSIAGQLSAQGTAAAPDLLPAAVPAQLTLEVAA